ncbi:putative alpha beta-hydrolase [Lyophyllum shimeji]|uniref:Carboxylic ester hydrolase n=1 Tax=Lyophyllum shimeji TaxID=47721 RepID=A0A9P3UI16_LYOSH|nr:putative alpha beta-hydrolase [Lyophyllum shimeji]
MVACRLFLSSLLASAVRATPVPYEALRIPHVDPHELLCQLPIVKKFLCPRTGDNALNIATPLGAARGTSDPSGATRFTVKYATANRWAPSTLASAWGLPTGSLNETTLPLACPQPGVDPSAYTEDCLSMVLYVPPGLTVMSNAPVLMWIHGGSFVVGSASGPGLDGSNLAVATNSIVAVVQYRLGALGFMSPDGTQPRSFGGTPAKITLAGQSSGANMIRALLAVPSAASLFNSAILHSDPMNFGFLAPATQQTLQGKFNSLINCTATDMSCRNSLSLNAILDAQQILYNTAASLDPSTGNFEPIRPVRDGSFITSPLDSTAPFPPVNKPIMVTSVLNDSGFAIYQQFPDPLPESWFVPVCQQTFGPTRTDTIVDSPHYTPEPALDGAVDSRAQLQLVGTDYMWKCAGWTFARNWVGHGGSAFVGEFQVGATYPGNEAVPFCTQSGVVCHQDDIQIVFGTVQNPTPTQASLVAEMQKRYKAFIANGNPNADGLANWAPATTSDVHALKLGGSGEVAVGACDPNFWGQGVQYDYQVYGI